MPRTTLKLVLAVLGALQATIVLGLDPHMDPSVVPSGCSACHRGHGEPGSPLLPDTQPQVCLACHDTLSKAEEMVRQGHLSPTAAPTLLVETMAQPFTHPVDEQSYSRHESDVVTCTSCHSPHRNGTARVTRAIDNSGPKMSTANPSLFEYQLCQGCHGEKGQTTRSLLDKSRLFNPNNSSYHPVEAPTKSASPSIVEDLAGGEINCTDCHGNSDPDGPRGMHGSAESFLLKFSYTTVDGDTESEESYNLCYTCHEREKVLNSSLFPEHQRHIVDESTSCATCHNPHGSIDNRALIRFGEETTLGGVSPSGLSGRLAYESMGLGSGACYLTCHGFDHSPETYGGAPVPMDKLFRRSPARKNGPARRPRPRNRGMSR